MAFDLTDPTMAEAVHEVEVENGRTYDGRLWRGWVDSAGRPNPRMRVPPSEQARLDERVLAKYMEKRQRAEAEAQAEAERQAELLEAAQAEAMQQREFADAAVAGGVGGGGAAAGEGVGGGWGARGGWPWGRSPLSQVSVPRHVAGRVGSMAGAVAGVVGVGMGLALSPLGVTGAGMTQVGNAVVNLLVGGLQSLASVGSSVLSLALGAVLAGAIGAAGVVVLSAVGDLFGHVAQAITASMQGVAQVVRDVFREAGEYARQSMQMVYLGGYSVPAATGALATFGALGVPPAETAGLFGQWSMRPEFLEMRLAPLGGLRTGEGGEVDWPGTLRGMRSALQGYPDIMRQPLLSGMLGAQGAQTLMPLMQMEEGAFERALSAADVLTPQMAQIRELREELTPLQAQVGMLATVLKVELASAALQPVLVLLQTLVELVRENREEIGAFMAALPERLAGWLADAAEKARELAERWPDINRALSETVEHLQAAWRMIEAIYGFITAHPTASAMLGGAALGIPGGPGGMIAGAMTLGGAQVGGAAGGVGGGVGGAVAGLIGGTALSRFGLTAARTAVGGLIGGGAETLAFPVGAGGASLLGAEGGLLAGGGTTSIVAAISGLAPILLAVAAATAATAYYVEGVGPALREAREKEREYVEAEEGARALGYVTPEEVARSFGEAFFRSWEAGELSQKEQEAFVRRRDEMSAAARGEREREAEGGGVLERTFATIRDRLRDIAEHTSPHRVQEAMRRGQEEAQRREPVVILVRPSSQFELELEQQEALRTWRGIQVAVG